MLKTIQDKARHRTRPLWAWLKLLWQRIDEDNMTTLAGNLAYVSLLSLVPLVAVVFALFAAFPMFSDVSIQLRPLCPLGEHCQVRLKAPFQCGLKAPHD